MGRMWWKIKGVVDSGDTGEGEGYIDGICFGVGMRSCDLSTEPSVICGQIFGSVWLREPAIEHKARQLALQNQVENSIFLQSTIQQTT